MTAEEALAEAKRILHALDGCDAFFQDTSRAPPEVLREMQKIMERITVNYARRDRVEMVEKLYPFSEFIQMCLAEPGHFVGMFDTKTAARGSC